MSNFRSFFDFFSDLSEVLHVNYNSIEKHCPVFFANLCFVTDYASSSIKMAIGKFKTIFDCT